MFDINIQKICLEYSNDLLSNNNAKINFVLQTAICSKNNNNTFFLICERINLHGGAWHITMWKHWIEHIVTELNYRYFRYNKLHICIFIICIYNSVCTWIQKCTPVYTREIYLYRYSTDSRDISQKFQVITLAYE